MMTRYRKMEYLNIPDIGLWVITISVQQPAASAEGNLKVLVTKLSSQRASRAAGPQGPAERSSSSGSGSPSVCRRPPAIGPQARGPAERSRSSSAGSGSQPVRSSPPGRAAGRPAERLRSSSSRSGSPSVRRRLQIQDQTTELGPGSRLFEINIWMWRYGRTFPREVTVADAVAMRKERVQESRRQAAATMQRRRAQALVRL